MGSPVIFITSVDKVKHFTSLGSVLRHFCVSWNRNLFEGCTPNQERIIDACFAAYHARKTVYLCDNLEPDEFVVYHGELDPHWHAKMNIPLRGAALRMLQGAADETR